jgi:hypothetical protein
MCRWAIATSMGSVNKRLLNPLCILIVLAAALAAAGPAAADVVPEGTGEPAYTNSTQNTQWFRTTVPSGTGSYRLKVSYYANNSLVAEQTVTGVSSGVFWANWSGVATLQHGGQYGICVQGQYTFPNDSLWISDGPNSCSAGTNLGKRTYTTIDRSKPAVAVTAAGGAASTKDSSIPVAIAFNDDVAGPYASTWTCVTAGSDPCGQFDYSAACSVPGAPGKSTTFACTADASQLPDGPVTVCARSADASVPDNPASATQTASAPQANLSDAKCDTVTLDRSVPAPDPGTPDPGTPDPGTPDPGTPDPGTPVPSTPIPGTADPGTPIPGATPGAGLQIGSLNILVPKRIRLGKVRQLVVAANASQAGRLTLRLTRGKKVYSRLSVGLSAGKTKQRLRLPRRLKAGIYTVKIVFKASGAAWAATGTTKVSARR